MTVRAHKPEFNFREKLKELDYAHVPYEKMPAGSVIQVYSKVSSNEFGGTVSGGSGFADPGEGHLFETLSFCPMFSNSKILLQSSNVTICETQNLGDSFFMTAFVVDSGSAVVHANVQGGLSYQIFNGNLNGQVLSFNNIFDASAFKGATRDIHIRLGPVSQSSHSAVLINRDHYAASYANDRNTVTFTIMEIKQ